MKMPKLALPLLATLLAWAAPAASFAAENVLPPAPLARTVSDLVAALAQKDHAAFIANGDEDFKGKLSREAFDAAVTSLAPRFKAGHKISYLGELKKQGGQVTLWKVEFFEGGDDALATLVTRDGKVAGFWIK